MSAISNAFSNSQTGALSYQLQNSQFQQLGKDLTSGNLSAAQSDFTSLQQAFAQTPTSASSSTTSNPVAQAFQQLSTDLNSGNLSGAKQDYSTIQQDLSSRTGLAHLHYQRPMGGGSGGGQTLMQDLNQLGQDLSSSSFMSGNLSAAQQAYGSPVQMFGTGGETAGLGTGLQASSATDSDMALSFMA